MTDSASTVTASTPEGLDHMSRSEALKDAQDRYETSQRQLGAHIPIMVQMKTQEDREVAEALSYRFPQLNCAAIVRAVLMHYAARAQGQSSTLPRRGDCERVWVPDLDAPFVQMACQLKREDDVKAFRDLMEARGEDSPRALARILLREAAGSIKPR